MATATEQIPYLPTQREITPQLALASIAEESASSADAACSKPDLDHNALFAEALSFQKEREYQKAIARYTNIIEREPQIAEVYVNRGAAYLSMHDLELALDDFDTALGLVPIPLAYIRRGDVHSEKGDYEQAVQDYSNALALNPDNTIAYIHRGHAFSNLSFYDRAIQDFTNALVLNPGNAIAHTGIGMVYSLKGDHDNAIEHYDEALKLDSGYPNAYSGRGISRNAKGDKDGAEGDLGKALELDNTNPYAYVVRGLALMGKGDHDRAVRDLDRALQLAPGYAFAQTVRGSLFLEKGDLDRAIQDLSAALVRDQQDAKAYNNRGVAYERKGDLARAMRDYDRALRIRPNQAAYANRGFGLLQQSRSDEARSDLLSARNMGMDIVSVFHASHGSVPDFEDQHNLKLPQDIANLVSVEEAPQPAFTRESILDMFERLRKSVPPDTWDELPTDLVKNKKHYLYGHPKVT